MSREIFRKTELKLYAETFSRLVLVRKGATPEDVKALTATKEWQEASQGQRDGICRRIKDMARAMLIETGYSREIVYRNIP